MTSTTNTIPSEPSPNLFALRGLTKSFDAHTKVIDHLDLDIERGKITVIIGPSGCGKTVLLKQLILLIRPDAGEVNFNGQRIDTLSENQLAPIRQQCGFLFQGGALFDSATVAENIGFPLWQHTDYSEKKINDLVMEKLTLVGLEHTAERMPTELSGGQQKRVALARAIALSPLAVLYDEPTTGLDPIRSDTISDLISKLNEELHITSVVVTHDMTNAYKIADRFIMLDRGHIIADGTPQDIKASDNPEVRRFTTGQGDFHH